MDVKTLCLGVLSLGDASGYEIKKMFEGPFAAFHKAGFGSIYPALGRLQDEGSATCTVMDQSGRPAKKVYSITQAGTDALKEALGKPPAPDKIQSEVMVMFFFADLLGPDHLRDIYETYLNAYREKAEHIRSLDSKGIKPGRLFARGFGLSFYEGAIRYMEENKGLLFSVRSGEEGKGK